MSYVLIPQSGDSLQVPQLVVNNLNNGREDYFRVALYILSTGDTMPESIQMALSLKSIHAVKNALTFWQGAGLLREERTPEIAAQELRVKNPLLTAQEVRMHAGSYPEIAMLMQEAQHIFGELIGQNGTAILATMYISDKMSIEYLLMGLAHFKEKGYSAAKLSVIRRRMEEWQAQGITTEQQLENYLAALSARAEYLRQVADLMHCTEQAFTNLDRTKIYAWYEQYHYSEAMISMAIGMVEGSERQTVKYINGILRSWYGLGYRQPRDVVAAQQGTNAVPNTQRRVTDAEDLLTKTRGIVPKFSLDDEPV